MISRRRLIVVSSIPFLMVMLGVIICSLFEKDLILILLGEFLILTGILTMNALIILIIVRGIRSGK